MPNSLHDETRRRVHRALQMHHIRMAQDQFEEQEAEKVKQWLLEGGAVLLINAGTVTPSPERRK